MIDALIDMPAKHHDVIIVGGGQAGLSMSYLLQEEKVDHLVIEKNNLVHAWKHQRWDSFTLVTPNWQCNLPGHPYDGNDPNGFMTRDEIIDYLERFVEKVDAPVLENTRVIKISPLGSNGYRITTSKGVFTCDQVVIAAGGYHTPIIPDMAKHIPKSVYQLHSEQYKNPQQLPAGEVLVVGSGQSGAQLAEDLHLSGRKVYLATGDAPRCARFYRGKDVVDWLADMRYYEMPVEKHPLREGVRDNSNHYVTGRDGGRDIDLRQFATQGMELFGLLNDFDGSHFTFTPNLKENLDRADKTYNKINARIDKYIAENNINAPDGKHYTPTWQPEYERETLNLKETNITTVLWSIGFKTDFSWIDAPIFNETGYPNHKRGITPQAGLYFIGLPWQHTWGSGRFSGVTQDAKYLREYITNFSDTCEKELKSA